MTKNEFAQFERFLGSWEEFRTNNEERHKAILSSLENLNSKIDSSNSAQDVVIRAISEQINDVNTGIEVRLNKVITTLKTAKSGLLWMGGLVGSTLGGLFIWLKDTILAAFH